VRENARSWGMCCLGMMNVDERLGKANMLIRITLQIDYIVAPENKHYLLSVVNKRATKS